MCSSAVGSIAGNPARELALWHAQLTSLLDLEGRWWSSLMHKLAASSNNQMARAEFSSNLIFTEEDMEPSTCTLSLAWCIGIIRFIIPLVHLQRFHATFADIIGI